MIKITFDNGETYTEEEFQRDLKRYFDMLEETVHGHPCKLSEDCEKCMFFKHSVCGRQYVRAVPINYSFDIMERVYNWSKEHPVVTNRDKLKEVFGIEVTSPFFNTNEGKVRTYLFSNVNNESMRLNAPLQNDEDFYKWLNDEYKEAKNND